MTYEEFLAANQNKLVGYLILSYFSIDPDTIETPCPPAQLSEEQLVQLKDRLNECIPLDFMITDLWDWDIRFENGEELSDDWYFEAVFGSAASLKSCSEELVQFFVDKCDEYDIDYNQSADDQAFENLIEKEATGFVIAWRKNIISRYSQQYSAK
ncbi:MAG: hypothetical protein HY942_02380 [Gammaproteobacteria bacterium]|nr:hypothetical protein [Gammaproteobacteria bacterium]